MSPSSSRCWIASVSTRRTSPVSCMSTPSTHAHRLGGQEVAARRRGLRAPAIGELASPSDSSASMRARTWPVASSTQSIVSASVTRSAVRVAALDVLLLEDRLDLRPRAVHDDQPDAEAVQQVEVVDDAEERVVGDDFAAEGDDERLAAKRVDVGRGRADPVHERAHRRGIARAARRRACGGIGSARIGGAIIASCRMRAIIAPRSSRRGPYVDARIVSHIVA